MPPLLELQRQVRDAVVAGEPSRLPFLFGGRDPASRLAIHRHHYNASLTRALLDKFPGIAWLVGERYAIEAAQTFARQHPPAAPCIAEYGADFPAFLANRPGAERLPYLRAFAELEWHLVQASIAIDRPPLALAAFAPIEADVLPDLRLTLQGGLRYYAAAWPVDALIKHYLSDAAPEHCAFEAADIHLEIRGARGEFTIERLDAAELLFRASIADGATIGNAAERALAADAGFEPGQAFYRLVSAGLVAAIDTPEAMT